MPVYNIIIDRTQIVGIIRSNKTVVSSFEILRIEPADIIANGTKLGIKLFNESVPETMARNTPRGIECVLETKTQFLVRPVFIFVVVFFLFCN